MWLASSEASHFFAGGENVFGCRRFFPSGEIDAAGSLQIIYGEKFVAKMPEK